MVKDFDMMVDLEAISHYSTGAILSIACVPFKLTDTNTMVELKDRGLNIKLSIKDQISKGFDSSPETLAWWKTQSEEAKKILIPSDDDLTIEQACDVLDEYFEKWVDKKKSFFYSRGIQYDFPFFQNLYRQAGREMPINSWNLIDTKTMIRTLTFDEYARYPISKDKLEGFVAHDALSDACKEVLVVQELVEKYYK